MDELKQVRNRIGTLALKRVARNERSLLLCLLGLALSIPLMSQSPSSSPIHFKPQAIAFTLDSCETPERRAPETMAGGVAVFDYDNDGNLDIFFTNGANIRSLKKDSAKYSNRLFRNNGDGTFTDVTEKAGLAGTGYDTGVAVADYDNDGYEDIFVGGVHHSTLYHNNGNGTFTDVSAKAGISSLDKDFGPLWSVGAAWLDVNNDGLLDLFILNYFSWNENKEPPCNFADKAEYCHPKYYKETPNQLLLNNGDGTFKDISASSGIRATPGKGMGVAVADYDGDGLPDLFVTNDKLFNFLFHNKGNSKFEEIAFDAGVALPEHGNLISGMGTDFKDLDNDGLPDIVLVALENETFPVYRNNGKGSFTEITTRSGMAALSNPMAGYSPNIADFDNDGWKDIFVSRGHVQSPNMTGRTWIDQPNTVFRNLANGKWTALTETAGFAALPPRRHRGSAVGDFNHDGKPDIAVSALSAPAEIWINDSPTTHHWIDISLQGTKSNRDGIGAKIKISAGGKQQYGYVSHAGGYASSSAAPTHFGLAESSTIDELQIQWPSGIKQTLRHVPIDRVLKIKESEPSPETISRANN